MKLSQYKTVVFDCDGVVLDSNKVKTEAFYNSAISYGESAAEQLKNYHTANGGISRYKKFEHFFENIVPSDINGLDINALLDLYANHVKQGLLSCDAAEGLNELREKTRSAKWLIVSGGDQSELRSVFASRGIDHLFDGGIFGSPDNKEQILSREIEIKNIVLPALFVGDSRYDHVASSKSGLDFIFLNGWTEFVEHKEYCASHQVPVLAALKELVALA